MNALPDIQESYKQIWRISMGPVAAKPMMTALALRRTIPLIKKSMPPSNPAAILPVSRTA